MNDTMRKRLETIDERLKTIDNELAKEGVALNQNHFRELGKERANLEPIVDAYHNYLECEKQLSELDALPDDDPEFVELAKSESKRLRSLLDQYEEDIKVALIPKDPNDDKNIIIEIRGAAGGDEANIFAGDLFRMYVRYAEKKNWRIQMIEENPCEAGGYSYVSFMIKGKRAYAHLKFESGAHRVQRVPKTEAQGRIHTSTATVLVMPEVAAIEVDIKPEDIQTDTYRAQGAGGQYVNKTESAVRMTHIPTGVVASCQTEKSQMQNRELCMQMLRAKIYAKLQEEQDAKIGAERRLKVGTGERSEKIRTYNYPQNRVSDHRINYTVQKLDRIMEGDLDELLEALVLFDQEQKIKNSL